MDNKMPIKMTFKQKIENFWYHYKWTTGAAIFLTVVLTICFVQCSSRADPDVKLLMYLDLDVTDYTAQILSGEIQKYASDTNENGVVLCTLTNLSYNKDNISAQNTNVTKAQRLQQEISAASNILFIVDRHGYDYFMRENLSLFEKHDFLPDLDGHAWNWKGSGLQKSMSRYGMPENLFFCLRRVDDTAARGNSDAQELEDVSIELLKSIISTSAGVNTVSNTSTVSSIDASDYATDISDSASNGASDISDSAPNASNGTTDISNDTSKNANSTTDISNSTSNSLR